MNDSDRITQLEQEVADLKRRVAHYGEDKFVSREKPTSNQVQRWDSTKGKFRPTTLVPGTGLPAWATTIADVAATASAGTGTSIPRGDHAHKMGILTTKGDLLTYDTGPNRFAVGANGTFLKANSSTATGLEWGTAVGTLVRKSADQSVTNSTTLVNDTHLFFAMTANTSYEFYAILVWLDSSGTLTDNLKIAFTVPTGADLIWGIPYENFPAANSYAYGAQAGGTALRVSSKGTNNLTSIVYLRGHVRCAGTTGNLQLQFAEVAAGGVGVGVTLYQESYLVYQQM